MRIAYGPNAPAWFTVGWIIALIALVVDIVFIAIGTLDFKVGGLFAAAFLARLL